VAVCPQAYTTTPIRSKDALDLISSVPTLHPQRTFCLLCFIFARWFDLGFCRITHLSEGAWAENRRPLRSGTCPFSPHREQSKSLLVTTSSPAALHKLPSPLLQESVSRLALARSSVSVSPSPSSSASLGFLVNVCPGCRTHHGGASHLL